MRQKDFDAAMKQFRGACVDLAQREQRASEQRAVRLVRTEARVRWAVPAFAALMLAAAGGGWAAWERVHAPQAQAPAVAHVEETKPAAVSDEALLSAVQDDLSDHVPQALEPLAVSYTGSKQARNGQEEVQ